MIEYSHKTQRHITRTTWISNGQIPQACGVIYLQANKRELELILTTAPFLADSTFGRTIQTWTGCEAMAAALAFNFTERK